MCDASPSVETVLPADLSAARIARAFVRRSLCTEHDTGVLERALLLISELAVNAVEHGAPPVRALVDCQGSCLHLEVSDGSAAAPVLRRVGLDSECGRGIDLIDQLSAAWGVTPRDDGKVVWCDLAV